MDTSWIITQVTVKDKTLIVFYDQLEYGLFTKFSSDSEVKGYIDSNLEEAFSNAVFKKKNTPYFLNIASVEKLGSFEWKDNGKHLNRMLSIYMPIIQKFIEDATANTLNVPLNEENNPKMWMKLTVF